MPEPMDPSENVPQPGPPTPTPPMPGGEAREPAPETGDIVVDAALRDLAAVDEADLDAILAAGDSVHGTLTARLSDLGT